MVPTISILVALITYVIGYFLLFDDLRHFLGSLARLIGFGILAEIVPGYVGPQCGRLKPLVWFLSGIFTGTAASLFVRYLTQ